MRYLHTMLRITDPEASLDFFWAQLGLDEMLRKDSEAGRAREEKPPWLN